MAAATPVRWSRRYEWTLDVIFLCSRFYIIRICDAMKSDQIFQFDHLIFTERFVEQVVHPHRPPALCIKSHLYTLLTRVTE